MFEYKTRTEYDDGCKFVSQDILLYDYVYDGDIKVECHVNYNSPGFGFVLLEEAENNSISNNVYVFKLGTDNKYQIINKQQSQQSTVKDEYVEPGGGFKISSDLVLIFEMTEDSKVKIYKAIKDDNGINQKSLMIAYTLPHVFESYKIGFYSSAGNILKFASIISESPSNWVSNIANGNGGRIHWLKNGFKIEDCEFDCEVESQLNHLEKGTYYFDFVTNNPDIKYYIYPSYLLDTDEKRPWNEILATKEDETKNILNFKDNSFTLDEDKDINIKFKGKWGTVKEIAIKKYKSDSFVETDYDNIKRAASCIEFDLDKIKKIELTGVVTSIPEEDKHYIFLRGAKGYTLTDLGIELNQEVNYIYENDIIYVNSDGHYKINDDSNQLFAFKNLDGYISKLIVTYTNGDIIDVILQKTFKITVDKEIKTPIIVSDLNENPYNLSSAYREVIEEGTQIDLFNKYQQLKLGKTLDLNHPDIMVYGVNEGSIDTTAKTISEFAPNNEAISHNYYTVDYKNNKITLNSTVKNKYKYCIVSYKHCDNFKYEFTNWERQLVDLKQIGNIYLDDYVCDVVGAITVYGIPDNAVFFGNRLYKVPNIGAINSIDSCTNLYSIIPESKYSVNSSKKISFDKNILSDYRYLIIDYLKDKSYTVNERNNYYEVDIATSEEKCKILYDSTEDQINTYSTLKLNNMNADNFIVLKKEG